MAQLASDDFNRVDSATLGANWTPVVGTAGIVSNECGPKTFGGTDSIQRYSAISWPNNQYSQITIRNNVAASGAPGPGVRLSDVAFTGYVIYCNNDIAELARWIAGAFASIGSFTSPVAGDVVKLETSGTTLRVFVNGAVVLNVTDANIAGGWAGINCGSDVARRLDDWSGGDTTEIGIFT